MHSWTLDDREKEVETVSSISNPTSASEQIVSESNGADSPTTKDDTLAKEWHRWFHEHVDVIYDHLSQRCKNIKRIMTSLGEPTITIDLDGDDSDYSEDQIAGLRNASSSSLFGALFETSPEPHPHVLFDVEYAKDCWTGGFFDSSDSESSNYAETTVEVDPLCGFEGFDGQQNVYVLVLPADPEGNVRIPETEHGLPTAVWTPPDEPSTYCVGDSGFRDQDHVMGWNEWIGSSFDALADSIADRFENVFAVTHRLGEPCIEVWLYGMEYMHPDSGPDAVVDVVQEATFHVGCAIVIRNERPFEHYRKQAISHVPLMDKIHLPFWGITQDEDGTYYQEKLYFPHVGSPIGIAIKGKVTPCVSTLGCFLNADGNLCSSLVKSDAAVYGLTCFHGVGAVGCEIRTLGIDERVEGGLRTADLEIGNVVGEYFTPKTKEDYCKMGPAEQVNEKQVVTVDATVFDFAYVLDHRWAPSNALDEMFDLPQHLVGPLPQNQFSNGPLPVLKIGCTSGVTRGILKSSGKEYHRVTLYNAKYCCTHVLVADPDVSGNQPSSSAIGSAATSGPIQFAKKGDSGAPVLDDTGLLYGFVLGGNPQRGTAVVSFADETLAWARRAVEELQNSATSHPPR